MSNTTPSINTASPLPLLSVKHAAQLLGTTPAHVARLCEDGILSHGWDGERMTIPHAAVLDHAKRVVA